MMSVQYLYLRYYIPTLDSLINVPPGIIVPPGLFFKIDKGPFKYYVIKGLGGWGKVNDYD